MDARLAAEIELQPHPVVYATVVGEHLYGFAGADSDHDLRAAHVLPARAVLGLRPPRESLAYTGHRDGLDFEFVSHDVKKVFSMLLKKNGQILEPILSPHVVRTSPAHEELAAIARGAPTTHMAHHFLSHARMLSDLFEAEPRVQRLLFLLRVLHTARHLLRTGEVECHLPTLAGPETAELIARRVEEGEAAALAPRETEHWRAEARRLAGEVERARDESALPREPPAELRLRLDDLLVRLRLPA